MDELFNWCVDLLVWMAGKVGMTYNEINIWIFVIIEPVIFLVLLVVIILQKRKIKALHKLLALPSSRS